MYKKNKRIAAAALLVCAFALLLCGSAFADDGSIHISSADDLILLAQNCTLDTWSQDKTVELDADISLDGVNFSPIPSFGGTFSGNGHTISGLAISGKYSTAGLFAELQESAVVKNLNVSSSVDISGSAEATGGIAGVNNGRIYSCSFTGSVSGSVNVGAIAGQNALTGSIQNCTSSGSVYGSRMTGGDAIKEAGDISVSIGGSGQIDGEANGDASLDVDVSVPPLDVDIDGSHSESGSVSGSVEIIATPDLGGLTAAINGIGSQLSMLNGALAGTAGTLADYVRAINDKFNELSNTMFDAIFTVGTEEGDILLDTSDVDIELVRLGKVCSNTNTGAVSGDINIGGITGAMAIEYDADPEDDVASNISAEYKREYELKAVLQNCTNKGAVTARRSYAGGIAGLAGSTVRSCWAKCTLSGGKYVGGIVGSGVEEALTGSGSTITGCVSMVEIADAAQYYGAISGADFGEYLENRFVADSLAGIDGRSVHGKAEPISYETLLGMDDLPAEFKTLHLSFTADGDTLKTIDFNYGDSFGEDAYPDIPAKDGYYASWDKTDLSDLHFDTIVTADYELEYSAVMADSMRGAKPVLFAEGKYDDSAELYYTSAESASGLTPLDGELSRAVDKASYVQLPWLVRLTTSVSGGLVEQLHVTIPDDGQSVHTLHYLPPEVSIGKIAVYVMENGRWSKADTTQFGSYLSFDVSGSDVDIATVSVISVWWLWGVLALVVLAITATIIASIRNHRRRRLTRAAAKSDGQAENTSPAAEEDAPAQGKKGRRKPAVMIVLILVCALAAASVLLVPRLAARIAPYKALAELERAQELSMNVTADGTLGDTELHTVVPVEVRNEGISRRTRAMLENVPLYYSNDMLILENGKAYGIGSMFPDYSSLLGNIAELYKSTEYTSDGDSYTVSISGTQAAELLKILCPALGGNAESIADAYAETVIENGTVSSITVSASGSIDGAAFEISAVIDGITHSENFDIPEKVSLAAAKNNASELTEISSDLFRIVSAWAELDGRESIVSSLRLSADCGPVVLNTALDVSSREYGGKRIYCVGKNDLKLYTDGSSVVSVNGTGVTDEENRLADSANLLDAVYLACLNGDISAARDGEKYTYTIALNGDGIAQFVEIISPAASELDADFAYGTVSITIDSGRITGLSVRCTGTMQVVLVETAVSVSADVTIQNGSAPQFPEKAVSALTQKTG